MDFIIKPSLDGAYGCLTSTEFPQGRIIHPFLGKKNKVCEVMVFDLIITDTKLIATSNILNLVDGRNSFLSSKAQSLLILSTSICCTLIIVTI
jgi:hypothetical protein